MTQKKIHNQVTHNLAQLHPSRNVPNKFKLVPPYNCENLAWARFSSLNHRYSKPKYAEKRPRVTPRSYCNVLRLKTVSVQTSILQ